jgi:hypothetical protein
MLFQRGDEGVGSTFEARISEAKVSQGDVLQAKILPLEFASIVPNT